MLGVISVCGNLHCSVLVSIEVCIIQCSETMPNQNNRPFPRSMRSQGKRPGRGSRQTGAVFEA